ISDPSGANIILRFDARALRAEAVLREHSATLVTRILDDQRVMLRNVMTDALSVGRGPMATALDIAGRVAPGTNRRVGGLIGLTSHQEGYVRRATEDLLSGDPERMKHYLELTRRDRRFDRTVLRAIANETPLDRSTVTRIIGRLSDSYLQLRAETIA